MKLELKLRRKFGVQSMSHFSRIRKIEYLEKVMYHPFKRKADSMKKWTIWCFISVCTLDSGPGATLFV